MMVKMNRVSVGYLGPQSGAIAYYRGMGPLTRLRREDRLSIKSVEYLKATQQTTLSDLWAFFKEIDMVYAVRATSNTDLKIYRAAKELKIPVILDFDDDVLNLPMEHNAFPYWAQESVKSNVIEALSLATLVIVSTESLKESFLPYAKNVLVINNAFDEKMFPLVKKQNKSGVHWRGSDTHDWDLRSIASPLLAFANANQDQEITFWGYYAWYLMKEFPRSAFHGPEDFLTYMLSFIKASPQIVIVPLVNNQFNRAKSNIAWIEATQAGACVIAANLPEFNKPGVLNYDSQIEFRELLQNCIDIPEETHKNYLESFEYIQSELTLEQANKTRFKAIMEVI